VGVTEDKPALADPREQLGLVVRRLGQERADVGDRRGVAVAGPCDHRLLGQRIEVLHETLTERGPARGDCALHDLVIGRLRR
jgi:hypothetical protein